MPRFSVLAGVLAWLILAPAAPAAVRVADPGGAGTACTDAAPCAIDTAINSAGDNDEVILNAGDYGTVAAPLTTGLTGFGANLAIHGRAGAARPSIVSSNVFALQFGGAGATLRDVSLRSVYADNGDALIISGSALAERVEVRAQGLNSIACELLNTAALRDATCINTGDSSTGLDANGTLAGPNNVSATNVTAVVTGAPGTNLFGNGVRVYSAGSGRSSTLTATNVIAVGSQHDVEVWKDSTEPATARLDHVDASDIHVDGGGTTVDLGGNITAAPQFVNAGAFDFHELASSPTVDAGRDDSPNGPFAFDLTTRLLGAHTDIGAAEYIPPPTVTTGPASFITTNGAQLNGVVVPNGPGASAHFEWGTTTAYGQTTPVVDYGSNIAVESPTAVLTSLQAGAMYHYRVVATNPSGTSYGDDVAFTTVAPAPVAPVLSHVSQSHRLWRVDRRHKTPAIARKRPRGTRFKYTLSVDATVRFTIQRVRPHKRPKTEMRLRRAGHGGLNTTKFTGRVGRKVLKPGRYRVVIAASNSAGAAKSKTLRFRVTRG